MLRKHNGFVLFIMLVYMQLFALLTLQETAGVISAKRHARSQIIRFEMHEKALLILDKLDQDALPSCMRNAVPPSYLKQKSLSWWRQYACHGVSQYGDYYFFQSALGMDRCVTASIDDQQKVMVYYYQQSLFYNNSHTVLAQESIAVRGGLPSDCNVAVRHVTLGRQTLRWLR